ncbi:hypothetical protein JF078_004540 [Salmonella enterica]|uniref:Uncharacterized protein n=1 Tax=Salmonella enterica subsp. enterica serovar Sandiego TaxID=1151002 RepID=A0A609NUC6_SALET|nr:hypothetical protein [Salmonella enterica]ECJ7613620.1 hypothetical protein [Salmonella enterica subsp. enterica serovar Sandiego]EDV7107495.1 hypothetical protein [Salmonella enterica subsp. enterica]EIB5178829.1 hypothetical protein [Salmonella enterica subsp. enterica serovar Maracaibo]EAO2710672.1 hypothetical protein [Salmonella enterica]
MLKRTAGYSDLLFTFRGLPRRPVWAGWLTAAVFAQYSPEHYRLTVPVFRLSAFSPAGESLADERPGMQKHYLIYPCGDARQGSRIFRRRPDMA